MSVFPSLAVLLFSVSVIVYLSLSLTRTHRLCRLHSVYVKKDRIGFQSVSLYATMSPNGTIPFVVTFDAYSNQIQDQIDLITAYYIEGNNYPCVSRGEMVGMDWWIESFDSDHKSDVGDYSYNVTVVFLVIMIMFALLSVFMMIKSFERPRYLGNIQ